MNVRDGSMGFCRFLSEAYEKTSPKTGKKICSYRLIECHIVSCMFNIAPQPQRPPKLRPKLHMHCGISSFFGRFVGFHIRHHNPLMLVKDNSFLNASKLTSKMTECQKLLPYISVKNRVFRIGVVQVAHWDHGPKKTFRSMEHSYC